MVVGAHVGAGQPDLESILSTCGLAHLQPLLAQVSLACLHARLASHRPAFLKRLKELGVEKVSERQALANAISRAEKEGHISPPVRIPHLIPAIFDESSDFASVTVRLLVPRRTMANQLTVTFEVNVLRAELLGEPTALGGQLFDLIKPHECEWEIERSLSPEYDPLLEADAQPVASPDTLVITLVKAMPSRWPTLFKDGCVAKRHESPPPQTAQVEGPRKLHVNKTSSSPGLYGGIGFTPRKFDPERERRREAEREGRVTQRAAEAKAEETPAVSAAEHWPSARATLLWRDGGSATIEGAPDHPVESGPLFTWVEDPRCIQLRASTRRGLAPSALSLVAKASSVECAVEGRPTPWCGVLVGKIDPEKCTLEVLAGSDAMHGSGSASSSSAHDTLQLTLVKAEPNRLWRAPWPELVTQLDLREKRAAVPRPTRDQLMLGGWDTQQFGGEWQLVITFKAANERHLSHDDLRVAVTADALNIHVAGQEERPMLAGFLWGRIDPNQCTWRIRKGKPRGTQATDELEVTIVKENPGYWGDLFTRLLI
jgi:hypothetical protein